MSAMELLAPRPAGHTSVFTYVAERSLGLRNAFQCSFLREQLRRLTPAPHNYIYDASGALRVWSMALEPVEQRFLLVGTSRSRVQLYDLRALDDSDDALTIGHCCNAVSADGAAAAAGGGVATYDTSHCLPPCAVAQASAPIANALPRSSCSAFSSTMTAAPLTLPRGVTAVDWYPEDGGLFLSASRDGLVTLWDANAFVSVLTFRFAGGCSVRAAAFSRTTSQSPLIAAATTQRELRLCDPVSGSSSHTLRGHSDELCSLAWAPHEEFQLVSGARDGDIRVWDIRRSGASACLRCLNREGSAERPHRASSRTTSSSLVGEPRGSSKRRRLGGRATNGDPHEAASVSHVRAHGGAVTALAFSPDGRFLVSSGHDDRVRLWHTGSGQHLFANYEGTRCDRRRVSQVQLAVVGGDEAGDGSGGGSEDAMLFHPNGVSGELAGYELLGQRGQAMVKCTAHYEAISSCVYRASRRQLWTGGGDGLIMKWTPPPVALVEEKEEEEEEKVKEEEEAGAVGRGGAGDVDTWSEDDDEEYATEQQVEPWLGFVPPILRG